MKESMISYELIVKAHEFYTAQGYKCIDVPLVVSKEALYHTLPKNILVDMQPEHDAKNGYVASAEQSFIDMYMKGQLREGKYFAITPCFRDEGVLDLTHYIMFLKVELIEINPKKKDFTVCILDIDAHKFFKDNGVICKVVRTDEGLDLLYKDIELGSYGERYMPDGTSYFYGTGLAEPRFSYARSLK